MDTNSIISRLAWWMWIQISLFPDLLASLRIAYKIKFKQFALPHPPGDWLALLELSLVMS